MSLIASGSWDGVKPGPWTGLWAGVWIVVEPHQENNYKAAGLGPWPNAILPVESSVHITV